MTASSYSAEALTLLERFKNGSFPIPVIAIAEERGISVFSDSYPSKVNGHIEVDENGKASIIVNENHSAERKRFTIAHEIAHHLMDMDYLEEHKSIDRDGDAGDESYRSREKRANQFAAELLMPEKEFVERWISLEGNLEKLCNYFGVSKAAAQWRAINTGVMRAE